MRVSTINVYILLFIIYIIMSKDNNTNGIYIRERLKCLFGKQV